MVWRAHLNPDFFGSAAAAGFAACALLAADTDADLLVRSSSLSSVSRWDFTGCSFCARRPTGPRRRWDKHKSARRQRGDHEERTCICYRSCLCRLTASDMLSVCGAGWWWRSGEALWLLRRRQGSEVGRRRRQRQRGKVPRQHTEGNGATLCKKKGVVLPWVPSECRSRAGGSGRCSGDLRAPGEDARVPVDRQCVRHACARRSHLHSTHASFSSSVSCLSSDLARVWCDEAQLRSLRLASPRPARGGGAKMSVNCLQDERAREEDRELCKKARDKRLLEGEECCCGVVWPQRRDCCVCCRAK